MEVVHSAHLHVDAKQVQIVMIPMDVLLMFVILFWINVIIQEKTVGVRYPLEDANKDKQELLQMLLALDIGLEQLHSTSMEIFLQLQTIIVIKCLVLEENKALILVFQLDLNLINAKDKQLIAQVVDVSIIFADHWEHGPMDNTTPIALQ